MARFKEIVSKSVLAVALSLTPSSEGVPPSHTTACTEGRVGNTTIAYCKTPSKEDNTFVIFTSDNNNNTITLKVVGTMEPLAMEVIGNTSIPKGYEDWETQNPAYDECTIFSAVTDSKEGRREVAVFEYCK